MKELTADEIKEIIAQNDSRFDREITDLIKHLEKDPYSYKRLEEVGFTTEREVMWYCRIELELTGHRPKMTLSFLRSMILKQF